MSEIELIFLILIVAAMGGQIGYAFGMHKAYKALIPELRSAREEASKLKLLARMQGERS